jgi:hypothetical protein
MILTLLWRWLRDLWRGDPETAAVEASPPFINTSSDGDGPEEPAAPR